MSCSTLRSQLFDAAIAAVAHKKFEDLNVPGLLKDQHVILYVMCMLHRDVVDVRL